MHTGITFSRLVMQNVGYFDSQHAYIKKKKKNMDISVSPNMMSGRIREK